MLVSCLHSNCDFLLFDDTAPPRVLTCEELAYLPFKTIYYLIKNQLLFIAIPLAKKQTVV